jgi:hypothetical protein
LINVAAVFEAAHLLGRLLKTNFLFCALRTFMPFESDKIMFEIYRETTYTGKYRVVYFTELQDHNKETEISRAMAGEHFYDGFIRQYRKDQAKEMIEKILTRMNEGEKLTPVEVEAEIKAFIPV